MVLDGGNAVAVKIHVESVHYSFEKQEIVFLLKIQKLYGVMTYHIISFITALDRGLNPKLSAY